MSKSQPFLIEQNLSLHTSCIWRPEWPEGANDKVNAGVYRPKVMLTLVSEKTKIKGQFCTLAMFSKHENKVHLEGVMWCKIPKIGSSSWANNFLDLRKLQHGG